MNLATDVPPVLYAMRKSERCSCGGRRFANPTKAMYGYRYRCTRCGTPKIIDEADIGEALEGR